MISASVVQLVKNCDDFSPESAAKAKLSCFCSICLRCVVVIQ